MPYLSLKTYLLGFCICLAMLVKGQNALQVVDVADRLYDKGEYYGSIGFYEKAMRIDSSSREVLYKYGRNLMKINQNERAARYLLKASLLGGDDVFPILNWQLAQAYHKSGEYRKARRFYNRAIRPYRRDRDSYWYKRIDQAKDAASWANKTEDQIDPTIEVENLGVKTNSEASDFSAKVYQDQIYWTALIAENSLAMNLIKDENYFSRFYTRPLKADKSADKIKLSKKAEAEFEQRHLANLTFGDSNTVFFSLCDTNYQCEIWQARLVGKTLSGIKKLNNNINYPTKNNSMPHWASLKDGNYLFFVSNRDRGFGGLDIWMAKEENFGFGEPINLGAIVNTPGDEISPFYETKSQSLYFSSDWHFGYGGYDIFKSEAVDLEFKPAQNIGKPINSTQDDLYFFPFNNMALLTSNRSEGNVEGKKGCCNDIFQVDYPIDTKVDSVEDKEEQLVGLQKLNQYLPLELFFHNDIPDPNSRDSTTKANYLKLAYQYLKLEGEYIQVFENEAEKEAQIDSLGDFFDDKLPSSIAKLEEFTPLLLAELEKGSNISLNIKGFASSLFNKDYNLTLTLRRIESLTNYLTEYNNGVFIPYLENNASNGGSLKIRKFPYGDFVNEARIDKENKEMAVYSIEAVKQRKIQLLAITESKDGKQRMDNLEDYQVPIIKFNTKSYDLGNIKKGTIATRYFLISNVGEADLEVYNLVSNSAKLNIDYPRLIKPSEKNRIKVEIPTDQLEVGENTLVITMASNAEDNLVDLRLKITVEE